MNRLARHELAQRDLRARLEKDGHVVVSASTTAPCDVISQRAERRSDLLGGQGREGPPGERPLA